jgi:hypothetical protein
VEDFESLKDQSLDQQLAVWSRRRKLQNWKKFATRKRIIRRAVLEVRKGHLRKSPGKSSFYKKNPKLKDWKLQNRRAIMKYGTALQRMN